MKKKVLLVSVNSNRDFVPSATAYLKVSAEKNALVNREYQLEIVDCQISGNAATEKAGSPSKKKHEKAFSIYRKITLLEKQILALKPFIVSFSCQVWNAKVVLGLVKALKCAAPGLIIVAGGPGADESLVGGGVDFVVVGEGEEAFTGLLLHFLGKKQLSTIPGLCYTEGGEAKNSSRAIVRDLSVIPSPCLQGIFSRKPLKKYKWIPIFITKGCPGKCAYCFEAGVPPRNFPLETVKKEIDFAVKNNYFLTFMANSAMNYSSNSAEALKYVLELKRKGKKIRVASAIEVHPAINPELLFEVLRLWEEISSEAEVEVGIQSLNKTVLENINRGLDLAVLEKLFDYAKKSTLIFSFDLIIGLPGDNFFSFCKSLKFVMEKDAGHVNTPRLRVYKHTPLFDRAKEFGIEFGKEPFFKVIKTRDFSERALNRAELAAGSAKAEYSTDYYSGEDIEFCG